MDIAKKLAFDTEKRLTNLREREKRCVCKYCGGSIRLRHIIFSEYDDARIDLYCDACEQIEFGVEPEIYQSAKYYTEYLGYDYYAELEDNDRNKRMNIARVCEIIDWGLRHIGFADENGYTAKPVEKEHIEGQCIVVDDNDIANYFKEG